ncbi:MAG: lysophospholipid acyltransferase family protein [Hydrogenothermaceae bacterium]
MFRAIYNFIIVSSFMLTVLIYGILTDLLVWDEIKRVKMRAGFLHRITKMGTRLIGININMEKNNCPGNSYFIVSNHLGYLDIVILSAICKTVFISTTEVGSTKFFGRLARYGGSIFIDRKNRLKVKYDLENIKSILKNNINVTIFLEGTTSNGDTVLPFKSSFLEVVFQTDRPVVGLCIKYKTFNGKQIDKNIRDMIYYYGDHQLTSHLVKFLLSLKDLEVEIKNAGLFLTQDYPSRKELANQLHHEISKLYAS